MPLLSGVMTDESIFLLLLFTLAACSSLRVEDSIPPFLADKVCSSESLAYLKKSSNPPVVERKILEDDIFARMLSLEPTVKRCYEDEMERTNKNHSFNLCFVAGYSVNGDIDYFEFSTREVQMSQEFKSCLSELKGRKELIGLKSVNIVQPFRLFHKR